MKTAFLYLILVASCAWAENKSLSLQKLEEDKDFQAGCGCSVVKDKLGTLAFASVENKAPITIKLDGTKKDLKWVSSNETDKEPKKGDKFTRVYSDGTCKLTLNFKVTDSCDGKDECESTQYSVDATVEQGTQKNAFKSLKGICGC